MPKPHFEDFMEDYHPSKPKPEPKPRPVRPGRFPVAGAPDASYDLFRMPDGRVAFVMDPYSAHPSGVAYEVGEPTERIPIPDVTGSEDIEPTPLDVLEWEELPLGTPAGLAVHGVVAAETLDMLEVARAEERRREAMRLMEEYEAGR